MCGSHRCQSGNARTLRQPIILSIPNTDFRFGLTIFAVAPKQESWYEENLILPRSPKKSQSWHTRIFINWSHEYHISKKRYLHQRLKCWHRENRERWGKGLSTPLPLTTLAIMHANNQASCNLSCNWCRCLWSSLTCNDCFSVGQTTQTPHLHISTAGTYQLPVLQGKTRCPFLEWNLVS